MIDYHLSRSNEEKVIDLIKILSRLTPKWSIVKNLQEAYNCNFHNFNYALNKIKIYT